MITDQAADENSREISVFGHKFESLVQSLHGAYWAIIINFGFAQAIYAQAAWAQIFAKWMPKIIGTGSNAS